MAYIPKDAEWYLADIVLLHTIEDDSENVVYINFVLIHASSPENAYEKALEIGHNEEAVYENTESKRVTVTFIGLRELNVIHDKLEHGAELTYERKIGLKRRKLKQLVSAKKKIGLFRPMKQLSKP